jgi:hypothetical protein
VGQFPQALHLPEVRLIVVAIEANGLVDGDPFAGPCRGDLNGLLAVVTLETELDVAG